MKILLCAIALQAWPAFAHDYWMVPSELVVPGEREVSVSLYVGEAFAAEQEKAFERARFPRLAHLHAGKVDDLLGAAVEGATPMLRLSLKGEGGHLIAGDRSLAHIEMEPAEFKDYVQHEGLTGVSIPGDLTKPVRERYSRFLKTLIQVGSARDDTFRIPVEAPLELVPADNPVFVEPGRSLPVSVLYQGRPLSGAHVEAFSKVGGDVRKASYTTDAAGQIQVAIDRRGTWLIRMVHMVRCEGCENADWESFWTSYSFATADPSGGAVEAPPMVAAGVSRGARIAMLIVAGLAAVIAAALVRSRRRRSS